ncbi:MAG: GntR family transcriptional regulator [Frankiales bacterium]|nr:GntR family transcriptional regulator [Frankiales bacterium]
MIELSGPTAPYEQVRSRLAEQIADGRLAVGTKLPSVRKLAEDLGLAPNTVARAYRELEEAGLVQTRGRNGTVVSANGDRIQEQLREAAQTYSQLARGLGVSTDEAVAAVRVALAD